MRGHGPRRRAPGGKYHRHALDDVVWATERTEDRLTCAYLPLHNTLHAPPGELSSSAQCALRSWYYQW